MTRSCAVLLILIRFADRAVADDRRPFLLGVEPDANVATVRRTQWWMFTAEWCPPCQSARGDFETWLKRSGWSVDASPSAHVRLIDIDRERKLAQQLGIRDYPTFLLMHDGRELQRLETYPGRDELVRRFQEAALPSEPAVGAISVGTITGQKENITQLVNSIRPLLGNEGTLTVRLDRPGTPSSLLPIGERFSIRAGNPLVMTYSMKNDVLTCRFAPPHPRGRFTFGLPVEQPVAAVSLSVSEVVFELPQAPDVRLNVGP
jgi:thiol-disulfide isomerase/thioredoxin